MLNKSVKPIWLASYPKSGNTWVSLFLSVLMNDAALDINRLGFDDVISSRLIMDNALGISSADIPEHDYLQYRSRLYHQWANRHTANDHLICKVHDTCTRDGEVLFPAAITRGVIYILRNPFDMAASLANHQKITIDKAVNDLCCHTHAFAAKKRSLNNQLSQHLGTWANHVESWVNLHQGNMLLIKYENLLNNGINEFSKIVNYIGLDYSQQQIQQAIEKTAFKNLQEQEKTIKFKLTPEIDQFFRSGKVGGWRSEITPEQVDLIINCNYDALLKYNYIDAARNVLV
jgi:hypothetical protein